MRFIDVTSLHHLGTRTGRVRPTAPITLTNVYGSTDPINAGDVLYRKTDIPGSYLFYELLDVDCKLKSDRFPKGSPLEAKYHVILTQVKVTKQNKLKELRGLLALTQEATKEPIPNL
jgi:hypothetical protein